MNVGLIQRIHSLSLLADETNMRSFWPSSQSAQGRLPNDPPAGLEPISIGLERERGGGVVDIFPEMEMIDGAALFGRSA
jgi:hypothetical protein